MLLWHLQNIICIMAFITNVIIAIIAIIVIIFFCVYRLTKVVFGLDTGFNWRKSFFYTRASCRSKNIVKSRWWVHLRFGWHPSKTCVKHRLWPSAGQRRGRYGAAYSAQSLYPPCTAGRTERNRYSPCRSDDSMAQTWRCIEVTWPGGTFLHASSRGSTPWDSLHVPGPSQSPRVDEPHLASIASTRSSVAGSARKCVAQVVQDNAGDTDGNHRKLAEDTLNGNDVQDRIGFL
jgi:hypothetical protein